MNISLPEALKSFVQERTKKANYSNPSDYVRSLIREDQRRLAATNLLGDMLAKYLVSNSETPTATHEKLSAEFWTRWNELRSEIDCGLVSLDQGGGKVLDTNMLENIKSRGRARMDTVKTT